MRRMADSVDAANLPTGFDLYAAYVDGHYANYQAVVARFGAKVIPIAVFSSTNSGIVGDCEPGNMTPQTAVSWVEMRRRAGVDPTIYCSESAWPAVKQAFTDAHVPEPHWWVAGYPGSVGQNLYPGSVAHQWIDRGPYDESVVADYWPGFDPPQSTKENPMLIASTTDAKGYICVKPNGAVYAFGDAKYHGGIDNAGPNGTSALAAGDTATGVVYAITDAAPNGGYWISTAQGHVYAFGGLPYLGAP